MADPHVATVLTNEGDVNQILAATINADGTLVSPPPPVLHPERGLTTFMRVSCRTSTVPLMLADAARTAKQMAPMHCFPKVPSRRPRQARSSPQ